jgi:hypothetical protein
MAYPTQQSGGFGHPLDTPPLLGDYSVKPVWHGHPITTFISVIVAQGCRAFFLSALQSHPR